MHKVLQSGNLPHGFVSVTCFSKACGNKVDPVYEALRFGTSLAQRTKRASGSESPHRNSVRATYLSLLLFKDLFIYFASFFFSIS